MITREEAMAIGEQAMALPRFTYPPVQVTAQVLKLCRRLACGKIKPRFVPVEPIAPRPLNECISHAERAVAERGGQKVLGWAIWEWPTMLLEAEFHVVWEGSEGQLIDVSPKQDGETRILFVPDPGVRWTPGIRIPNKRMPLRKLPELDTFITAAQRRHELIGETVGSYLITPKIAEIELLLAMAKIELARRTPMDRVRQARTLAGIDP